MAATVDVTDRRQVRATIDAVVERFGKLDVMFNNAGVNKPMNFLDVTEENWDFIMRVNGLGVLIAPWFMNLILLPGPDGTVGAVDECETGTVGAV